MYVLYNKHKNIDTHLPVNSSCVYFPFQSCETTQDGVFWQSSGDDLKCVAQGRNSDPVEAQITCSANAMYTDVYVVLCV